MAKVYVEGQVLPMPDQIAENDQRLIETVSAYFPQIADAQITRRKNDSGELEVTMVKRAGHKGGVREALITAPAHINPAVLMQHRLLELEVGGLLTIEKVLELSKPIEKARDAGFKEMSEVEVAKARLAQAIAVNGQAIPKGF